jgi:hypothetical protein
MPGRTTSSARRSTTTARATSRTVWASAAAPSRAFSRCCVKRTGSRPIVTKPAAGENRHVPGDEGYECFHCKQWVEQGDDHDCWTTTEAALTQELPEDLRDAWVRLRDTVLEFGPQRVYASHRSIMLATPRADRRPVGPGSDLGVPSSWCDPAFEVDVSRPQHLSDMVVRWETDRISVEGRLDEQSLFDRRGRKRGAAAASLGGRRRWSAFGLVARRCVLAIREGPGVQTLAAARQVRRRVCTRRHGSIFTVPGRDARRSIPEGRVYRERCRYMNGLTWRPSVSTRRFASTAFDRTA